MNLWIDTSALERAQALFAGFWIVTLWQGLTFAWHGARTIWLGFLSRGARPEAR